MQYAVSNWIYGDEPLRQTFSRLAHFGYQGVELVGEPERYETGEVAELREEFGLEVTSVLSWCIWGIPGRDLAAPDDTERSAAERYCRACVDLASEVGAPIVVVLPAPAGRTAPTGEPQSEQAWISGYKAEWDNAVNSTRRAATYAAARDVLLALEPINRYETFLVTNVNQALEFLNDVGADNLKLHLDTFHMNIEEPDLAAAVRQAGDLLMNMHVSDSNREAPGRGHIDFTALMQALNEVGYEGALALEPVPPGSDPLLATKMSHNLSLRDTYAQEGISYLKRVEQSL
ncbi:MAG: sugar phosphate isomerase/epimerase family protein [Anaerolineae bacterium]|jgi:sugar phosphate isomerase/epimerase